MATIEIDIKESGFAAHLEKLLSDITAGVKVDLSQSKYSWMYEFFSDEIDPVEIGCACIHEFYLKDWVFNDYDVSQYSESESEEVSDAERVSHARMRMKGLLENYYDAPGIFFIDLMRSGERQVSIIISVYSAGQGGWYYDLVTAFSDGSYETALEEQGFIDLNDLEHKDDQWILDRWVHED